ncbi:MAG: hypothetical protein IPM82_27060 [Saprospiraceae bacterium]|nr:hypothetical protein [Saprospiraceae bacterium]
MHHGNVFSPQSRWFFLLFSFLLLINFACSKTEGSTTTSLKPPIGEATKPIEDTVLKLDTADYKSRFEALNADDKSGKWLSLKAPYPNVGAILPFNRVIAYYGNFYSKRMGILGEYPEDEMLEMLQSEAKKWELADSLTPVVPAIHYIAVTAQRSPGKNEKYRQRMPKAQIEKALTIAKKIDAIVILDIQIGLSSLEEELPQLDSFLSMPNVHLGIDPEFSMKTGARPGKKIGSFDAEDVNYAAKYLAGLVKLYNLPPKMLIVHRFTKPMLTNYEDITPLPEVQIVVQMDGWGGKAKKKGTYQHVIYPQPVQFSGFKIFYKHDTKKAKQVMQPEEVLQLVPKPIYIQYQ